MASFLWNAVHYVQQFAEEEGLLLGVSLAGYALDMWFRLLHASRSLDRVKRAPAVDISHLPALAEEVAERSTFQEASRQEAGSSDPRPLSERCLGASGASAADDVPFRLSNAAPSAAECVIDSGLVVVRGRVEPSKDKEHKSWQYFSGPALVQAETCPAKGVVVEKIDKVVCSNVHQFLHNVTEHQVDLRRSQVPFDLSEIPSPSPSAPSPPSPSASSSPSSSTSSSSSLPLPSLPSLPSPPQLSFPHSSSPSRVRISLEGLTQPLPLVTVHSSFHRSAPSVTSVVLHLLTGSHPIGQKVEERVLAAGTDLTAVGRMRRDNTGRPVIAPAPDMPIFLTTLTKEQLVVHLSGTCAALLKTSLVFSCAAIGTLGYFMFRRWDHRRRQERARRLVESMAEIERAGGRRQREEGLALNSAEAPHGAFSRQADAAAAEEGVEDVSNVGNGELCVVCLSRRRRAVFVPCGHMVCCWGCAVTVQNRGREQRSQRQCPVCRAPFSDVVRVWQS